MQHLTCVVEVSIREVVERVSEGSSGTVHPAILECKARGWHLHHQQQLLWQQSPGNYHFAPTTSTAITLATTIWQLILGTYNINSNYFGNNHLATNTWHLQHQQQLLWQQPPGNYRFAPTTSTAITLATTTWQLPLCTYNIIINNLTLATTTCQ